MAEVGSIYVSVMPTTAGLTRQMNQEITGAFDGSARRGESTFRSMFTRVAAIGATILATLGLGRLIKDTAKLGIEYNTLLQTSRAAFTTLLGSSEAAADMLDSIRELSMATPFPRQVYIKAAQQMVAFGIESNKVVGYLDAITDAVAAAGGNSQTLAEISYVMAQISAAGKITAQDLHQFGQRGIVAAELIGSQMGKTGAQIQEMITAGALEAGVALDALAAGMHASFDGAAENVKTTWLGTVDRLKGTSRDLAGALLTPFIDPEGGGYAVKWGQQIADMFKAIEESPAITLLQGKLRDIGEAIDPFFEKLHDIFMLLKEEDGVEKFNAALTEAAPLIGFLVTLAGILQPLLPPLGEAFTDLANALIDEGVIEALTDLAIELLPPLVDLLVELLPLVPILADFLTGVLVPALRFWADGLELLSGWLEEVIGKGTPWHEFAVGLAASGNQFMVAAVDIANGLAKIANGFIDTVNGIVGAVESLINAVAALGSMSVSLPRLTRLGEITIGGGRSSRGGAIPGLADSGTILPRPGGTLILAAEAGRAESVVDTGKLNDLMDAARGAGGDMNFYMPDVDVHVLARLVAQEMRYA